MRTPDADRAVSPVVGIVLMLVITLLLAGVVGAFALGLDTNQESAEGVIEGDMSTTSETPLSAPEGSSLVLTKEPGDEPRTNKGDNLIFRIENTRNESVTVVGFAVDATGIDEGVTVDNNNAAEVEIKRANDDEEQRGIAKREGSPDTFAAHGTVYEFVSDSTTDGQNANIASGTDDAEVDIREFSQEFGPLTITASEADADLTVRLVLSDGSHHLFHFSE